MNRTSRRGLLKALAVMGVGGQTLLHSGSLMAAIADARRYAGVGEPWPDMTYTKLGRTGYRASRLIFGCGAALSGGRADDLLEMAFDAGINVFDVGGRRYYDDAEVNLAPFLKRHRQDVFLISKSGVYVDVGEDESVTVAQARAGAATWSAALDTSLSELEVDHVDAYYMMASHNPSLVGSEEMHGAFQRARGAGKVRFFGISTHQNAQRVLEKAIEVGYIDLAMVAITPAGFYDWNKRTIQEGTASMRDLRPLFDRARAAGIGLVGMKAGRYIAGRRFLGWGNPGAFDDYYDDQLLSSPLNAFQRSYAYVVSHGMDVVNADMQRVQHLRENYAAVATASQYVQGLA
jgi:aryl-alcohol dehydrogenase-like predicted oxidoreductase